MWLHKRIAAVRDLLTQKLDMPASALMDSLEFGCDNSDPLRQLPFVAGPTAATLAIVSAWAYGIQRHCGLKAENNKLSASVMLSSILRNPLHAGLQV